MESKTWICLCCGYIMREDNIELNCPYCGISLAGFKPEYNLQGYLRER